MSTGTPAISTPPLSNKHTVLPSPNPESNDQCPSPMTMLAFFKGPSPKKKEENPIRKSICFGFVSNQQQEQPTRNADRPRVITNWKSESETQREIANSLDQPSSSPINYNRFRSPHKSEERIEPLNLKSIPAEVLLPFGQREKEIFELLAEKQNVNLYNRLKDRLQAKWAKFESEILGASRLVIGDQEWIMTIRALIEPLDDNLWVSFRGLIGADGLDRQDTQPTIEHDWHVQPVKLRRSSFRSTDNPAGHHRPSDRRHSRSLSDSSLLSGLGSESDLDAISAISLSPRARMDSIKEQEGSEGENLGVLSDCPMLQNSSDTDDDEPDRNHVLALKILDDPHPTTLKNDPNASCLLSHGLKYSFGQVVAHGLGLQSSKVTT
ncbi:hypothetical protein MJO28_012954 [Puccinia striiformis f. sp. tritici]|uniref:Uncharacterized protein n=1 Tax=Puccinia striiformis f. sp. tritici TaxID=168172 RepID=A0ACC0DWV3_9BASI|nr:hypothetical protein Pst134EB_025225 [Puccinia striiformis f. sp. tritici]KAI7940669.1 hypothetical protein MJO28_012954 [Puccinia striiformis f. sp. tritici]KAI7943272.1 hypothetical protein MJO29_013116 [Puccinia striiformis f. sp. tritici]